MIHAYFDSEEEAREVARDLRVEWHGAPVNGKFLAFFPRALHQHRPLIAQHPKTKGVLPHKHSAGKAHHHAEALGIKNGATTRDILEEVHAVTPLWFFDPDA